MTTGSHSHTYRSDGSDWDRGWSHWRHSRDRKHDRDGDDRDDRHHGDSSYCHYAKPEPKVLAVSDSRAVEGESEIFTVTLSGAVLSRLDVSLALAGGSATLGSDFRSPLEVSFDGGTNWSKVDCQTVKVGAGIDDFLVRVATIDDKLVESAERFTLAAAANGGSDCGTGTIDDNDAALPTPTIGNAEGFEGEPLVFDLNFSSAPITASIIRLTLADDTAIAGEDYQNALEVSRDGGASWSAIGSDGQLTVAAGETALQLRVQTIDDANGEPQESFTLNATLLAGGGTASATGVIFDNDSARIGNPNANTANALLAADVLSDDAPLAAVSTPAAGSATSSCELQVAAALLLPADDLLRHLAAQPPAFA